jgi:hypothetical protein
MYSLEEVSDRLQTIHKDYNINFLQEKIASGEIKAHIGLSDCFLFPVSEADDPNDNSVNGSYHYLELYDFVNKKDLKLSPVHESNDILKNRRESMRLRIIFSGLITKNHTFEKVNETVDIDQHGKPPVEKIQQSLIKEIDLDSSFGSPKFFVIDSCEAISGLRELPVTDLLNKKSAIIKLNCTLPVTPYFWQDSFGLSFMASSFINKFKEGKLKPGICSEIKLSNKDKSLDKKLAFSSVVEWQGEFYYVVNKNRFNYEGLDIGCYSLSSDVFKSYQEGGGIIITKENLEKFEKENFQEYSSLSLNTPQKDDIKLRKEGTFLKLSQVHEKILQDFSESEDFKKYGQKIQQQKVKKWLEQNCRTESDRRVLKELINQKYKIGSGNIDNPMLTIC